MYVTQIPENNPENCQMKNFLYASALFAVSLFTMSCSSTTNTAEAISTNTSTTEPITSSDTTKSNSTKSLILDVRTQDEWDNDGHAPCAKLIPLDQLEQRFKELKPYSKITVVCRSGARAGSAAIFLKAAGFTNVSNAGKWQNAKCE